MTPAAEDNAQVRVDIAELRGLVQGNLNGLQRSVERLEKDNREHKAEFDQVHQRTNQIERDVSSNKARLTNVEAKASRAPAWGSLAVAGVSLLVAIGGALAWSG